MKRHFILIFLFYFLFIAAFSLSADLIHFKNGRTMEGKILSKTNDAITLKIPGGTIDIPQAEISRLETSSSDQEQILSPEEIYLKNKDTVDQNDPEAHFQLGVYCTKHELFEAAKNEFDLTIRLNSSYREKTMPYLNFIANSKAIELLNKAIEQNNYTDYSFALETLLSLKEADPVFFKNNSLDEFAEIIKKNITAQTLEANTTEQEEPETDLYTAQTANFLIFSDTENLAEEIATYIESLRDQVTTRLGFSFLGNWEIKCKLYVYSDYKKFLNKSAAPTWAAGWQKIFFKITKEIVNNEIFISTSVAERLIIAQMFEEKKLRNVLLHEIAHLLYLGFIQGKEIPLWFNEGIAVYAQQLHVLSPKLILSNFKNNISYPLEQLFYLKDYPGNQMAFYQQASSIVDFLITNCNQFNFIKLTKEIKSGVPFYEAFFDIYRGYFQNSLELETSWLNYLNLKTKE